MTALTTSFLFVILGLRFYTVLLSSHSIQSLALTRGILSDIAVSIPIILFCRIFPTKIKAATFSFFALLGAANSEHIRINSSNIDIAFAHLAQDSEFFKGSFLSQSTLIVIFGTLSTYWITSYILGNIIKRKANFKALFATAVIGLMGIGIWPPNTANLNWLQMNYLEENLRSLKGTTGQVTKNSLQTAPYKKFLPLETPVGPSILDNQRGKNVILVLVEALSQQHVDHGILPQLKNRLEEGLLFRNFVANQRQTNRGLYSIFCNRYPNFISREAKSDLIFQLDSNHRQNCLPYILTEKGYQTIFMQSAPLSFMRKDLFGKSAGFQSTIGNKSYGKAYYRNEWGIDDRSLYRYALMKTQELEQKSQTPYFLSLLTAGTHHPFNTPLGKNDLDSALAYADQSLGEFINNLEKSNFFQNGVLIISSDEANLTASKITSYDVSENHGFLWVKGEGVPEKKVIQTPFSLVDLTPSILELTNITIPDQVLGRSVFQKNSQFSPMFFGNIYQKRFYYWSSPQEIQICSPEHNCSQSLFQGSPFGIPLKFGSKSQPGIIDFIKSFSQTNEKSFDQGESNLIFQDKNLKVNGNYPGVEQLTVQSKSAQKIRIHYKISNPSINSSPLKITLAYHICHSKDVKKSVENIEPGKNRSDEITIESQKGDVHCLFFNVKSNNDTSWILNQFSITR